MHYRLMTLLISMNMIIQSTPGNHELESRRSAQPRAASMDNDDYDTKKTTRRQEEPSWISKISCAEVVECIGCCCSVGIGILGICISNMRRHKTPPSTNSRDGTYQGHYERDDNK